MAGGAPPRRKPLGGPPIRSLAFVLRYLLARSLIHPLEGVRFAEWVRLLKRERFRIGPLYWPRALWVSAMGLVNSVAARAVERRFGAAIAAARVEAPVFVLGHYRSGTTFLHALLTTDPNFTSPTRYEAYNPSTFLVGERWLKLFIEPFMLPRRAQEDEIALLNLSQASPYMAWCFPRSREGYEQFNTFEHASPAERAEWSTAMTRFLKMLVVRRHKPLILKSPPHTGRVKLLLELFPDARFVHIRRNPYVVYSSTIGLLKRIRLVFRLQSAREAVDVGSVLRTYSVMYDAYFADRELIPAGQLVEISYEDLERDPAGQVRAIYEGLALGDFEAVRPHLEAYLGTVASYRKNRHRPLDDATKQRVAEAWGRCFDAWGYPR